MTEIEPTIDNVQPGDIVTVERGTPGELGYSALTVRVTRGAESVAYTRSLDWLAGRARRGVDRITRIDRPAPPIPTEPGERFWARWNSVHVEEYMVTQGENVVHLASGTLWRRWDFPYPVVPAPEPDTVPVPADLIREAKEWDAGNWSVRSGGESILGLIIQAVREREGADDE